MTLTASPNSVAVVTGASSGIGAVYARRLAARGFNLLLVARRGDRLATLAHELEAAHKVKVSILSADLTKEADLLRVEQALRDDKIEVLVNNAGNAKLAPFSTITPQDSADMVALNVTALTRLTQTILPGLVQRKKGTIINVSSVLALHALPVSGVYSGTKGYVLNFSRSLQAELAGSGVTLQLVMPAATATEIWDLAGIPLAELAAGTVMTADNLVDAALAGLDAGEEITLPSVHDFELWNTYDAARANLFGSTQTGVPAPRYKFGQ